MSFSELGLSADILRAVAEQGYTQPTPVQSQAIPVIMAGGDILAGAQTGTGKTAGFTLPLLQRLSAAPQAHKAPRALILTPTRELAAQVAESVQTYGKYLSFKSAVIFGGVNIKPQIDALRRGVDIIIATPGRLLDHVGQRTVDLSHIEILVLDEADRMLDMGFIHDIRRILALLPQARQNLLFSATYSEEIRQLADKLLKAPTFIDVARRNATVEAINQVVHRVDRERKRELLSYLIGSQNWRQVLVFTRTKHGANRLAEQLGKDGITSAAIHGNKSQGARTRALSDFKAGQVRVLVATDIAARGLDIDQLPHVVNYELPNVPEDYVHRIGRTGRAGATGEAVALVCVDELKLLGDIQRLIKRELPVVDVEGYAPDPKIKAEPILNGRRGGAQARNTPRPSEGRNTVRQSDRERRPAASVNQARPSRADTRRPDGQRPVNGNTLAPATSARPQGQGPRRPDQQRPRPAGPATHARTEQRARPQHAQPSKPVSQRGQRHEVPALFMGRKVERDGDAG